MRLRKSYCFGVKFKQLWWLKRRGTKHWSEVWKTNGTAYMVMQSFDVADWLSTPCLRLTQQGHSDLGHCVALQDATICTLYKCLRHSLQRPDVLRDHHSSRLLPPYCVRVKTSAFCIFHPNSTRLTTRPGVSISPASRQFVIINMRYRYSWNGIGQEWRTVSYKYSFR